MKNRNFWKKMIGNKELLAEVKRRNLEPLDEKDRKKDLMEEEKRRNRE